VRLVLLALLDRGVVALEVIERPVPLYALRLEVAVGHRVADGDHPFAGLPQRLRDRPGRLALARTRAYGADGDDGHGGVEHRVVRA
jgi:hypothetical protein